MVAQGDMCKACGRSHLQDERKVVALTLAPNEEQLLAMLDDGGLWGLDLTRLNSMPVRGRTP